MKPRLAALAGAALLALLLSPLPAAAGTEEFSTFSVFLQERDDESLLDHLLTRAPREWRDEWENAPQAMRTSQGCLTSSQWFLETRLKLSASMGERARFGLELRQDESDRLSYDYLDFSFRLLTRHGAAGVLYRPLFDKSRQDIALFYEAGTESSATRARVAFALEDAFNNFWAFRQTQVGETSEAYEKHPFEPSLWLLARRSWGRAELGAQWLTPSRKRLAPEPGSLFEPRATLWGALAFARLEGRWRSSLLEVAGEGRQARSGRTTADPLVTGHDLRRQWAVEAGLTQALAGGLEAEARWIHQERSESSSPPFADRDLGAVERVGQLELRGRFGPWSPRLGFLRDRATVGWRGEYLATHGTRTESRLYVGVARRIGRVLVHAVEGIELDPEPYEVWGVHDKTFVHLQTVF